MKAVKKYLFKLLMSVSILGLGNFAFAENLLVNGSFELPGCTGSCVLDTPTKANFVTGWTTFLSGAEYFNMPASIPSSVAADGVAIVDLANYVYKNGGGIQQNFATVVGAKYRLTFSAGNAKYAGRSGTGLIQVKVAGQSVTFNTPVAPGTTVVWGVNTYDFTATTPQTTLAFSNEQDPFVYYAFIDNVIVEKL